jgi:hypothetical protein
MAQRVVDGDQDQARTEWLVLAVAYSRLISDAFSAYYSPAAARTVWRPSVGVSNGGMELSLLLIVIGILLAVLVNYGLGLACILIGLVLLIWPRLRASA